MNVTIAAIISVVLAAGQYAPVNGLKLYYEEHGKGAPLVLMHGGGSSSETLNKLVPLLAKTRRVIVFDQQGHGRTADVARPFSFEQSADDAAALMRHLHIAQADFYGFSNGGTIALQVAIRHPQLVRRLVIASRMFKRDGLPPQVWEFIRQSRLENMPSKLREGYLRVAPHPDALQSFFDKGRERILGFKDFDIRGIQAPTLIILGDRDAVRPEHALEMLRTLPHSQLAILPNTDHDAVLERAEWQAPLLEEFLK